MKIAIGADHAGWQLKEDIKTFLNTLGHNITDFGTNSGESVDYPDFAKMVAISVSSGKNDVGVLLCGTGIGMAMTANKIKGIRAAVCHNEYTAEMSRRHNDANVFCAGARTTDADTIKKMLKLWLSTPFEGGRHKQRVDKIDNLHRH